MTENVRDRNVLIFYKEKCAWQPSWHASRCHITSQLTWIIEIFMENELETKFCTQIIVK